MKVVILAFDIPRNKGYLRVKVWRELQKIGAKNTLSSHWILPYSRANFKNMKKLSEEIKRVGGRAEIIVGEKVM
jgi:hypothetical protein